MAATIFTLTTALALSHTASGFKFLAIGDWGASFEGLDCSGSVSVQQKADAVAMGQYAASNNISHVMLLGDNFYGSGIHGTCENCRFEDTFEKIYDAADLESVPFYAIAGNHDHLGNVSAQIEYSKLSKRWKYPSWYYSFYSNFTDNGKDMSIQFIMIDTVINDAVKDESESSTGNGYVHGPAFDVPGMPVLRDTPSPQEQLEWLENELKNSKADYVWVAGHYPVWSGCNHGPSASMGDKVKPLLEQYHATGYMCGHDHCEEYIDEDKGPVYVLTGSGFECCYKATNADKNPEGSIKFAYWDGDCPSGAVCPPQSPNSAFTVFTATSEGMTVDYIDSAGAKLFSTPLLKPRTYAQKTRGAVSEM